MTLTRKQIAAAVGVVVGLTVGSFLGGRYSKQGSRQEESKSEATREMFYSAHAKSDLKDKGTVKSRKVKVEHREPTGAVTTTTTTDTLESADLTLHLDSIESGSGSESVKSEQKVVTSVSRSNWAVGVGAVWNLKNLSPRPEAYAASLEYRLVGPLWLKAEANTDKAAQAGLRLEF